MNGAGNDPMNEQIKQIVESHWQARLPALIAALAEAAGQVERIVSLEDHYRSAYQGPEPLSKALGGFGGEALDLQALSSVLQRSHAVHFDAGLTFRRFHHLERFQARCHVDTKIFRLTLVDRFFLCFHDIRQRSVARFV